MRMTLSFSVLQRICISKTHSSISPGMTLTPASKQHKYCMYTNYSTKCGQMSMELGIIVSTKFLTSSPPLHLSSSAHSHIHTHLTSTDNSHQIMSRCIQSNFKDQGYMTQNIPVIYGALEPKATVFKTIR